MPGPTSSPEPAQRRPAQGREQGRKPRPVLKPQSCALITELSAQNRELMAQSEDLDILLAVGHAQQP
ncbi:hypothetical protein [Amycolatopsis ultiminotia]|uniref:hypothetical protein n=1 Tax=Amycolatopsis ultiminotia TaxID=543629 RepID=UPI0031F0233B